MHRTWHQMGGHSTCTMLYGHIERAHHRVDHLRRLRELQDETGGFTGFIPLLSSPMELALFSMEFPMRPLSRSFEIWR